MLRYICQPSFSLRKQLFEQQSKCILVEIKKTYCCLKNTSTTHWCNESRYSFKFISQYIWTAYKLASLKRNLDNGKLYKSISRIRPISWNIVIEQLNTSSNLQRGKIFNAFPLNNIWQTILFSLVISNLLEITANA